MKSLLWYLAAAGVSRTHAPITGIFWEPPSAWPVRLSSSSVRAPFGSSCRLAESFRYAANELPRHANPQGTQFFAYILPMQAEIDAPQDGLNGSEDSQMHGEYKKDEAQGESTR